MLHTLLLIKQISWLQIFIGFLILVHIYLLWLIFPEKFRAMKDSPLKRHYLIVVNGI